MSDFPPIRLPLIGLYTHLDTLFSGEDKNACQQALVKIGGTYREMGVIPLTEFPSVLYFPNRHTFNTFLDDMKKHGCRANMDVVLSGYGQRAILKQEVSAEGEATNEHGQNLFVAFQLIPAPEAEGVHFENMLPPRLKALPPMILTLIYRLIQQISVRGIIAPDGVGYVPLSGFYVALAALDFSNNVKLIKQKRGDRFFSFFDKMFDVVDSTFAGGSGVDFASMAQSMTPNIRQLFQLAIQDAFTNGLSNNTQIIRPEVEAKIRVPMPERNPLEAALMNAGGTLTEVIHDGTFWTLTTQMKAAAFHDDTNGLSNALDRHTAQIIDVRPIE
jgi:hypothetical protein